MLPWWLLSVALAAEIRGMTVSTPTWGREWGTDAMAGTVQTLDELGVNWVSYHPYARITDQGELQWRDFDPQAPPDWLVRPIREAHARGMKVMVAPHLAQWGSSFGWRGAIAFSDPAARARFFADYERWLVAVATAVWEADALVVGSELDGTIQHEAEWRAIIASARRVFPGPITYASNWDKFEQVPFWDALDAAGIQAYFPVASAPAVPNGPAFDQAWADIHRRLRLFHQRTGKYVVFTELGYDAGVEAAVRPWESGSGGQLGAALQQECLRAALRALDREPVVLGAFLWKWFPGEATPNDFRMSNPELRAIIAEAWRER
jgi:hypothetical protein